MAKIGPHLVGLGLCVVRGKCQGRPNLGDRITVKAAARRTPVEGYGVGGEVAAGWRLLEGRYAEQFVTFVGLMKLE